MENLNIALIGCGMIGIGAIVRAALRGAKVIAVDLDNEKLELAKRVGASYVINSKTENVHERMLDITEGFGADVVIASVMPKAKLLSKPSTSSKRRLIFAVRAMHCRQTSAQ